MFYINYIYNLRVLTLETFIFYVFKIATFKKFFLMLEIHQSKTSAENL